MSLCQVGAGCTDVGDVNVYSGTSGWVCTTVDKLHLDMANVIASIVGAEFSTNLVAAALERDVAAAEAAGRSMVAATFSAAEKAHKRSVS